MVPDDVAERLLSMARKEYDVIVPDGGRASLYQCINRWGDRWVLWFHPANDRSSHIVTLPAETGAERRNIPAPGESRS